VGKGLGRLGGFFLPLSTLHPLIKLHFTIVFVIFNKITLAIKIAVLDSN
jgi:hypothetical protein